MALPPALRDVHLPEPLLELLRRLGGAGHRSYLVGGAVRDLLLGRPEGAFDFDVATPATPREVTGLFRRVIPTGIEHGTVTVLAGQGLKVEVTTFRGEGTYLDGRRPGSVVFHGDLEADLARRDFTVNAMAFDPLAGELVDPAGGQEDLGRRLIRAVGDPATRFSEDGLRPLRAIRFAAQLGFALDPATAAAIPGARAVVERVSAERVSGELLRIATAPHVAAGLDLLGAAGLLGLVLPPLDRLPEGELRHVGAVAAAMADGGEPAPRLAALLHRTPPTELAPLLARLRLPRRLADEVAALVAHRACAIDRPLGEPSPARTRRWLSSVTPPRAPTLLDLAAAEAAVGAAAERSAGRALVARWREAVDAARASGAPLAVGDLALDGRAVMELLRCGPGPHLGEALRALLDLALEDPSINTPERLGEAARGWWRDRRP